MDSASPFYGQPGGGPREVNGAVLGMGEGPFGNTVRQTGQLRIYVGEIGLFVNAPRSSRACRSRTARARWLIRFFSASGSSAIVCVVPARREIGSEPEPGGPRPPPRGGGGGRPGAGGAPKGSPPLPPPGGHAPRKAARAPPRGGRRGH